MDMDKGIIRKVNSTTLGNLFIGMSQKISCSKEAAGFTEMLMNFT